ncbi:RsfA family transcriptional regulator [Bacillus timonensis]|nr:RsfA family transcriptional regulator [Bacillus timonensis]
MSATRQDAWTQDEDLLLAEVVLRHIREGGTQLAAFEEVGRKLSRTSAACGFRWNSYVRKQYKTGIEHAKKQRKNSKNNQTIATQETSSKDQGLSSENKNETLNIHSIIKYLENYESHHANYQEVKRENEYLRSQLKQFEQTNKKLLEEKLSLKNSLQVIEEDYKALIEIMDRARKMVVLQEDERSRKVKFQMDRNGNLERVEK